MGCEFRNPRPGYLRLVEFADDPFDPDRMIPFTFYAWPDLTGPHDFSQQIRIGQVLDHRFSEPMRKALDWYVIEAVTEIDIERGSFAIVATICPTQNYGKKRDANGSD